MESHGYVACQDQWITLDDGADDVTGDRTDARIAFPGHCDAIDKRGAGGADDLSSMGRNIAESDYTLHGYLLAPIQEESAD